jgi:hypothetical protein
MKTVIARMAFALLIAIGAKSTAMAQLPFSNAAPAPTVSPYLNLLNNRGNTGLPAYQTLVQPILQQQQDSQQQQSQISRLAHNQKASSLAATGLGGQARGISNEIRGTGHPTSFLTYGSYYPRPQATSNDPILRRLVYQQQD